MTIQESIKALEDEYGKRILGAYTNTTVIAEAIHILSLSLQKNRYWLLLHYQWRGT